MLPEVYSPHEQLPVQLIDVPYKAGMCVQHMKDYQGSLQGHKEKEWLYEATDMNREERLTMERE